MSDVPLHLSAASLPFESSRWSSFWVATGCKCWTQPYECSTHPCECWTHKRLLISGLIAVGIVALVLLLGRDADRASLRLPYGSGLRVQGSGFRVQGSGSRVQGLGFRVQGSRFRV